MQTRIKIAVVLGVLAFLTQETPAKAADMPSKITVKIKLTDIQDIVTSAKVDVSVYREKPGSGQARVRLAGRQGVSFDLGKNEITLDVYMRDLSGALPPLPPPGYKDTVYVVASGQGVDFVESAGGVPVFIYWKFTDDQQKDLNMTGVTDIPVPVHEY